MSSSAASFTRGPWVEILERDRFSMVSSWSDSVVVTRSARGRFGVYSRKLTDPEDRPQRWITIHRDTGLETPEALNTAFREAEVQLNLDIEWWQALPKLAELDWSMAAALAELLEEDVPPPPAASVLFAQGSLRKDHIVTVAVEWGYELYSIDLPIHLWTTVCAAKPLRRRSRGTYEGSRFGIAWQFNLAESDSLLVDADTDGGGWSGSLGNAIVHGPNVFGIDVAKVMLDAALKRETESGTRCPFCRAPGDCGHLLLIADKTFRHAEGGVLVDAFNDRWSEIQRVGQEENGDEFDEREAFEGLLEEVNDLADAQLSAELDGPPGMSSAQDRYYARSKAKAAKAIKSFLLD